MATLSLFPTQRDERPVESISKGSRGSANASSLHSKKTTKSKSSKVALQRQKDSEQKAAKDREQRAHRLCKLWSQAKHEERAEYFSYLKERVSLQHELIKQQDELFRKRQKKLEEKHQQTKETKRLARLARSTEYAEFVKNAIAVDKLRASKLKSHVRVISSHQPTPRLSLLSEREIRAPLGVPYDTEKTDERLASGKSELETSDFGELLDLPLAVQLKFLLGSTAESFLKPTFREGAKKTLDPMIAKQSDRGLGAKELWSVLRNRSWKKLEREDALIGQDVKNAYSSFMRECLQRNIQPVMRSFCSDNNEILPPDDQLSESHLLQDVYFTRHRLDLMFRIAHMNRDKTRLLFRSMGTVDMDGPGMMPVDAHRSRLEDSLRLSKVVEEEEEQTTEDRTNNIPSFQYRISPDMLSNVNETHNTEEQTQREKTAAVGTEKIVFLTEAMTRCEGEFSKRHKAPGANVPADTAQTTSCKHRPAINSRMSLSAPVTTANMRSEQKKKGTSWEPLSLNALLEYKQGTEAPGSGTFRNGKISKWNVIS